MKKYPKEIKEFIQSNYKGTGHQQMADMINTKWGTWYTKDNIKIYYHNHGLNSGLTGARYEKGHVPVNKGKKGQCAPGSEKGWFPKGHLPVNHVPIGSERIDTKDGYTLVKTAEPNVFELKHRVLWESENGKIPKGHILCFKDGNKQNIVLDNLMLVTRAEHLELTRSKLRSENPKFTETGLLIVKNKIARKRKRGMNHENQST